MNFMCSFDVGIDLWLIPFLGVYLLDCIGFLTQMVPDEADDLWNAYNLIAEGDTVLAVTVR